MRLIPDKLCARLWPIKFFAAFNFFASFAAVPVAFSLVIFSNTFRTLVRLITVHAYGAMSGEKVI